MKKKGFTLIELMIVLAIIAVLTAISFMAISRLLRKIEIESTVSNTTQGVLLTLNKARLESVVYRTYIPVFYEGDTLTYESVISTDTRNYNLPDTVLLTATPNIAVQPFTKSATVGFYLGFFVRETFANIELNERYSFLIVSERDETVNNQIVIDHGLPFF